MSEQLPRFATVSEAALPHRPILRNEKTMESLASDEDVEATVAYIGTLTSPTPQPTLKGNEEKGARWFGICMACHGPEGEGNATIPAPRLAGLPDWYVSAQLKRFRDGTRGSDPLIVLVFWVLKATMPPKHAFNN